MVNGRVDAYQPHRSGRILDQHLEHGGVYGPPRRDGDALQAFEDGDDLPPEALHFGARPLDLHSERQGFSAIVIAIIFHANLVDILENNSVVHPPAKVIENILGI